MVALLVALALVGDESGPWKSVSDPAQAGWSVAGLERARQLAAKSGSAAVFAVADGVVVAAWGEVDRPFETHSVRKSLLSVLVGAAVADGTVSLDATLAELGIDDASPLTASERGARVRDLLAARSGIYHPAAKEPDDMKSERPARGSHEPGTHFHYNNWDFNVAGVILARARRHSVGEEFLERLADPLGMEDFDVELHAFDQLEPSSSLHPAYSFRLSARDLARVGQLCVMGGRWNGEAIVPEAWIAESTAAKSTFADGGGYGFMWWVRPPGSLPAATLPTLDRFGKFAAIGTGGQFLLVVPDARFVFVHLADTDFGRAVAGPDVWRIAELVLAARGDAPRGEVELVEVAATPLPNATPRPAPHLAIPLDGAKLAEFAGRYGGGDAPMTVRMHVHEGRLFVDAGVQGEYELFAEAPDRFFSRSLQLTVEFERDAAGAIVTATANDRGRQLKLPRRRDP